ncbi:peptidoglycan editing factor PgeF [Leptothrix discophora]|uniref:Purine nucleoside phosphorylase n=1 Tax=Leptothrix discophora TaxID=89 RepID=A0ABT9G189_LEPDI|nr:peptidoglycan editing factor PgeF [Leptothrix discophora]MDP4300256.1 peptidoglycan editing factor PgeF [Leptothrix discophora]
MSTRVGGVSVAPFDALNLKAEIGDDPAAVAVNRTRLQGWIGARPVRLDQVHGTVVCALEQVDAGGGLPVADASVCGRPGLACEVQVADCLPVLFADRDGRAVAAAHAGWRGLAGGVLEATLAALHARHGVSPDRVEAWLGPCIGPAAFEVGADVLAAFGGSVDEPGASFRPRAGVAGKWWADLAGLARKRLAQAGVTAVGGNDGGISGGVSGGMDGGTGWCTASEPSRFFSFRRDRLTGRMAGFVWLRDGG